MSDYQDKWWGSWAEAVEAGDFKIDLKTNYKINSKESEILASFLTQWSNYIVQTNWVGEVLSDLAGSFSKVLYEFSSLLETIFERFFSLFGLFSYLGSESNFLGQFYSWFRGIGTVIFITLIIARVCLTFFSNQFKYKEFFNHLILVTASTAFLPQALTSFSSLVYSTVSPIRTYSDGTTIAAGSSLSVAPYNNNVVDLLVLAEHNFNTEELKLVGNRGAAKGIGELRTSGIELNDITKDNIKALKFGETIGSQRRELLETFNEDEEGEAFYGVSDLFRSEINSRLYKDDGTPLIVQTTSHNAKPWVDVDMGMGGTKYFRYKVNWFLLFFQQFVVILMLIGVIINMGQSIFRTTLSAMVAPIVGYTSVTNSTKYLDLLQQIFSGVAGLMFEVLIIRFGLWFLTIAPTIVGGNNLTMMSNLSLVGKSVATILLYLGVYTAMLQGSKSIENWLGVPTGTKGGIATAMMGGAVAAIGARATTRSVIGTPTANGRRGGAINHAKTAGRVVNKGLDKASSGLGASVGAISGVAQSIDTYGFKNTAKGLGQSIGGKLKGFGNSALSPLDGKIGKASQAHQKSFGTAATLGQQPFNPQEDSSSRLPQLPKLPTGGSQGNSGTQSMGGSTPTTSSPIPSVPVTPQGNSGIQSMGGSTPTTSGPTPSVPVTPQGNSGIQSMGGSTPTTSGPTPSVPVTPQSNTGTQSMGGSTPTTSGPTPSVPVTPQSNTGTQSMGGSTPTTSGPTPSVPVTPQGSSGTQSMGGSTPTTSGPTPSVPVTPQDNSGIQSKKESRLKKIGEVNISEL